MSIKYKNDLYLFFDDVCIKHKVNLTTNVVQSSSEHTPDDLSIRLYEVGI